MYSSFFFNDPATTEIYTLSLHDALPIYVITGRAMPVGQRAEHAAFRRIWRKFLYNLIDIRKLKLTARCRKRSEEHTSELQSHVNLVCRLLLEKKKKKTNQQHPSTHNPKC